MDLLNKITAKNLKLNRKRTIVTIIGIMLLLGIKIGCESLQGISHRFHKKQRRHQDKCQKDKISQDNKKTFWYRRRNIL